MKSFLKLILPGGIKYISTDIAQESLNFNTVSRSSYACCPSCNRKSKKVHSYKKRKIRDLPISTYSCIITLRLRKYYCSNHKCKQKIFTERIKDIPPYSRYTDRTRNMISSIAIETSANKTAYISNLIQVPVSSSTALRMVHSLEVINQKTVTTLGIDDWALRKGMSYGTILIDMDTNAVIDLLPGRDGVELRPFLSDHPEIKNVCRDRSSSYAAAVKEMLPDALQVADRFHLVKNISDCIYDILKTNYKSIKKVFQPEMNLKEQTIIMDSCIDDSQRSRPGEKHYADMFYIVKDLKNRGVGYNTIAKQLKISRNTVKKYDLLDSPVVKQVTYQNNYHLFIDQIQHMHKNGMSNRLIFEEIKKTGFSGSGTSLNDFMQKNLGLRAFPKSSPPVSAAPYLSARKISIYLGLKKFNKISSIKERELMRTLLKKSSMVKKLRKIFLRFKEILKNGSVELLNEWLKYMTGLNIKRLNRLAKGIKQDFDAVCNAILTTWSSGKVEGKINKLKTLKRQMYGRAGLELLRRKMILSKTG